MKGKQLLMTLLVVVLILSFTITTVGADAPVPLDPIDWDRLAPQEERSYTAQPDRFVFQEDGISVDGASLPLSPYYEYTYLKKPIFYFTRDYADKINLYSVSLYDDYYGTYVYPYYDSYATCTSYYCYMRPAVKLEPAGLYHSGYYEWAVQSFAGGLWQPWSGWAEFRVMLKKYLDTFDLYPWDWYPSGGNWFHVASKGQIKGYAPSGLWVGILRDGYFEDVDYTVLMKRKDAPDNSNAVIIAGYPYPLTTFGEWDDGIYFQYTNGGYWAIWKNVNGAFSWIQYWVYNPSIVNEYGWNELRVVTNYPYYDYWLNGTYLGWIYDTVPPMGGYTGLGFAGSPVYDQKLVVDYAKATAVQYTSMAERDPAMQLGLEPAPEGMDHTTAPLPDWDHTGTP